MTADATGAPDRRAVLRDALRHIEQLETRLARLQEDRRQPIAVVGLGCRFPGGADDPALYWRLLADGVDAISEVPAERWDADAHYDPDPEAPGKMYTRFGGFLSDVAGFDADFFGIAPREAIKMDPQHRLLLEVAWAALEDAGIPPHALEGSRTGVFVGITGNDYQQHINQQPDRIDAYHMTGGNLNFAAGRLAYVLGAQGPTLAVDTACSSSLVAVHLACQSLRLGESRLALACGVNAIVLPEVTISAAKAHMLAPDGRCKTFDARADGFVRGEGCGVVVLKRLADALADGDRVLAVIRGSAVGQDGKTSGLTVPNRLAQEAVIRAALAAAGLAPGEVGYVEAHGTGTALGDPIEVRALEGVFGAGRDPALPLLVGSVKTNIGHLESAAGVAGLIKVVLALQHEAIPPHLNFATPSPHIAWEKIPIRVPMRLTPWPRGAAPRIAGLSSFGGSGTNAHVVIEEAPAAAPLPSVAPRARQLLVLSARSHAALRTMAGRLAEVLAAPGAPPLADVAFTAAAGRTPLRERLAAVAATPQEAAGALRAFAAGGEPPGVVKGVWPGRKRPRLAFLFTGQGSQYAGMGSELYRHEPVFRAALERCQEALRPELARPLLEVMFGEEGLLGETEWTQPALVALEWSLAELWRSWGVVPSLVMGHSVGEVAAACVAGVLEIEDALRLVAARGRVMQETSADGAMIALQAGEARVLEVLAGRGGEVSLAAVNGPESVVVSGRREDVEAIAGELAASGVKGKRLEVSHAFHSPLMEPVLGAFERVAAGISYRAPRLALVSNVTGRLVGEGEIDAGYWARHVRRPVRFAAGMETALAEGCEVFVEVGPRPVLLGMGRALAPESEGVWLPTLRRGRAETEQVLASLGELFVRGVEVDWEGFHRDRPHRKVGLPTYPFERRRFWLDAGEPAGRMPRGRPGHPLLGDPIATPLEERIFHARIGAGQPAFLHDHRVAGEAVVPAAAFLEMALAAAVSLDLRDALAADVVFARPLRLDQGAARTVQTIVAASGPEGAGFRIFSRGDGEQEWQIHVEGTLQARAAAPEPPAPLAAARDRCRREVSAADHYDGLARRGLDFGPAFRGVEWIAAGDGEALGRVSLPAGVADSGYRVAHPALLDACLQLAAAALPGGADVTALLPASVGRMLVHGTAKGRLWSHVRLIDAGSGPDVLADVVVHDEEERPVIELREVRLRPASAARPGAGRQDDLLYAIAFRPKPLPAGAASGMPGPVEIAAALAPSLAKLAEESGLPAYGQALAEIESIGAGYTKAALAQLGWAPRAGERLSQEPLARRLKVSPDHARLFGRLLEILGEEGHLRREGESWVVGRWWAVPSVSSLERRVSVLRSRLAGCASQLALLERCGACLAEVLVGERDPLEILFPGGSLALAEQLNQETPFSRFHNGVVREAVARLARGLGRGRRLRVLEIGAGTGSATTFALDALPADRTDYHFTDLSTHFIARAREKFRAFDCLRYGILDIEQDPAAQGLAPGSFDLVLAANVLHATRDIGEALGHVRRLLAPGGTLILLEGTGPQRWVDLTFGMTEGWWRFKDEGVRPAYPLVDASSWHALLDHQGFTEVASLPEPGSAEARASREAVIIARAPGAAPTEAGAAAGRWLVFSDATGLGRELAGGLRSDGGTVVEVRPAGVTGPAGPGLWTLDPARPQDARRLVREAGGTLPLRGVVHLWSLDCEAEPEGAPTLEADVARVCGSILHLVQALAREDVAKTGGGGLWLVTRGAQPADAASPVAAVQAPVTGLAKVVAIEHPELGAVHVDLDPRTPAAAAAGRLLEEIRAGDGEDQVALRGNERLVARLARAPRVAATGEVPNHRLEIAAPGVLDGLAVVAAPRSAPRAGEVEIRVRAAGLNFRDVLCALGMYPGDPAPIGVECVGQVVAVGPGVWELGVGDEVMGVALGSFAAFVTTDARLVVRRPAGLGAGEAATIPSTFLTAWYALHELAHLGAGERILIHSAAGGVGLSALQVARRAGAEVLATAGSHEKREFLRGLGVATVMDSRSLDFADEVLAATGGRGVDVVLNSLTGEAIPRSLCVLAPGGRFIELGQREVWDAARVAELRPGVAYTAFNLLALAKAEPERIGGWLGEILAAFSDGSLTPLPRREFPLADAASAFRFMAQARHIGKVVLTLPPGAGEPAAIRSDGAYLVTGGLSGLGLAVAERLAERGAGRLVLMGRRGPDAQAEAAIARMRGHGAEVVVEAADVARPEQLARVLSSIRHGPQQLRGVVHAAGSLDDGVLMQQDWSRFAGVLAAKVSGSWLLHRLTSADPIEHFVLFSSAVALFGRPGQGNHAAANAFEDALAHARARHGLPGISINWGPWGQVGAATRGGIADRIEAMGFTPLAPAEGISAFEQALADARPQVAVMAVDWHRFQAAEAGGRVPRVLEELLREKGRAAPEAPARVALAERVLQAPAAKRQQVLLLAVHDLALGVLGLDPARRIDPQQPLHELGLDSLMAVELRNALSVALGRALPATLLFDYPTLAGLAGHLARHLEPEAPTIAAVDTGRQEAAHKLDQLSEAEAEAQLLAELAATKESTSA